jgi:hypothetical protein
MKLKSIFLFGVGILSSYASSVMAQESETSVLSSAVESLQSDNDVAKRLKISGYLQAQYQVADTAGVSSVAGGNFGAAIDNRFTVRRGRVKVAYTFENATAVMQMDITEKGVGIKDAYLSMTEPWLNALTLTGGVFDRPFGYEITYSSSTRETPERSRMFQTLFPGERDLGAKLTIQAPKTSNWNFLKLELGLLAGNGINVETDSYKDIVARLSASKVSRDERLKWGVGASYYNGGFAAMTNKVYTTKTDNGVVAFQSESINKYDKVKREYLGIEGQIGYDWALGITQVRAEYLMGTQPATASSSSSLTAANVSSVSTANLTTGKVTTSSVGADAYSRSFNGYYVYLIQDILQTPFQAVVKYDVYDPNTKVSGNQVGATPTTGVATNAADIAYSTLGVGVNYRFNSNVKIIAYYDMVRNETTTILNNPSTLTDLSADRKDNVFTLRVQYKF